MPITTEKTLVIYNSGDPASLDYMNEYIKIRRIPSSNLYGIDTPTNDIYDYYEEFNSNLLIPIKDKLKTSSFNCIVLGYRIPSGFIYQNRVYSCSSLISLINEPFDGTPKPNPFYNPNNLDKYESKIGKSIFVCFNLDAKNSQQIKVLLNKIRSFKNDVTINGSFYLDIFNNLSYYPNDNIYKSIVDNFYSNAKRIFNIDIRRTYNNNNSIEPCFSLLINDSIFWGWGDLLANDSYFSNSDKNRLIFMSYDNRSLTTIRTDSLDNACMSALNKGYACVAGNIGDGAFTERQISEAFVGDPYDPYYIPLLSNHVVPNPFVFMEYINNYRSIGEALLFSRPYLHDSFMAIGDPHIKAVIEKEKNQDDFNALELWKKVEFNLSQSASYILTESQVSTILYERCLKSNDFKMKNDLSKLGFNLTKKYFVENRKLEFSKTFESLQSFSQQINFQIHAYDDILFNNFLQKNNLFVSKSIISMFSNSNAILSDQYFTNIKRSRTVDFQVELMEMIGDAGYVHIELQVSLDPEFNQIISTIKSYEDVSYWLYEKIPGSFENFPQLGIYSGLIGRKIKVTKQINFKYDLIGKEIFIRHKQILNGTLESDYFVSKAVITS